ncbi:ankyrin repeat-containing protein ITN1-like [Punica granatum]|uniref:Ankyrin repeat-containing protein ITN1-like n=1 Tax=Punica granatum TaxID=22663 RepID=A0A6P8BMR2_PUNGR|nr:ankyrin repeat-containing protein ITN1-like [Punica granatum]
MASEIEQGAKRDLEKGLIMTRELSQNSPADPSPPPSPSSRAPALVLPYSGKTVDHASKKKYVKQVTGSHNDIELHLAAQRGGLPAVRQFPNDIDLQMVGTLSGAELDERKRANKEQKTALDIAVELPYLKELMKIEAHRPH